MDEGFPRLRRDSTRATGIHAEPSSRPERAALRALLLALSLIAMTVATAHGSSGGVGAPGSETVRGSAYSGTSEARFGSRVLRVGMQGEDVRVMNGIVSSKVYGRATSVTDLFEGPTAAAIREFQRRWSLSVTGVVNRITAKTLTRSMKRAGATWYGPGFYGNRTACGRILRPGTIGVAHRTLRCGTRVTFAYRGRHLVVPVIDRGPYSRGNSFDLTSAAATALGFTASGAIRYAVAR
jgi:peptidoglycan hydrolase-like protein with peptidoglycan-binding domain